MNVSFVDREWAKVFIKAASEAKREVLIITPFIQKVAASELLRHRGVKVRVITRFDLTDFYDGVSDLDALDFLLDRRSEVKGIKNLHSKLYVFDSTRAILSSANLTHAALYRNHEFGLVTDNGELVRAGRAYFERLWELAGRRLTRQMLNNWRTQIEGEKIRGGRVTGRGKLKDYGADLGLKPQALAGDRSVEGQLGQSYVKLFGEGDHRSHWDSSVLDEIRRSGCHWACSYPQGKRPRRVQDGALMFMGRLVRDPNDVLIFGRAIGVRHVKNRDDASPSDIERRPWKERWPHYVRVRDGEFVAGILRNGVPLNQLMNALGANAFVSTQRNLKRGVGNTNPRRAYRQQAAVELTAKAAGWVNARLDGEFRKHGRLTARDLSFLDWPDSP